MEVLQPGSLLQNGKYRIEKALGQGGFGITYEGIQTGLNRRVAIKEFFMKEYCNRDDQTSHVSVGSQGSLDMVNSFRQKFIKEAQLIAHMEDAPHIVHIHDIFEENGTAYYVMEYIGGGSLNQILKKQGPLPEPQAIVWVRQIGEALNFLHAQNTLHLDIKPSNVLINKKGEAVLIDFGVSKHYDQSGSQTSSTPVGLSKGFAPTEQYQSGGVQQFTPATDIYSLGATLYNLLTNQVPPEASIVFEDGLPPRPQYVSEGTWHAIEQAMQPRRKDRTQTVDAFLRQLAVVSTTTKPDASPYSQETVPAASPTPSVETKIAKPVDTSEKTVREGSFRELALLSAIVVSYVIFYICTIAWDGFGSIQTITSFLEFNWNENLWWMNIGIISSIFFIFSYGIICGYGFVRYHIGKVPKAKWFDILPIIVAYLIARYNPDLMMDYIILPLEFTILPSNYLILIPLAIILTIGICLIFYYHIFKSKPYNDWVRWMLVLLSTIILGINIVSLCSFIDDFNYHKWFDADFLINSGGITAIYVLSFIIIAIATASISFYKKKKGVVTKSTITAKVLDIVSNIVLSMLAFFYLAHFFVLAYLLWLYL